MKFNRNYNTKRDIFAPGVLTQLTDDVISGKPGSEISKLSTDEMHKLPEIYSGVDYFPSDHANSVSIMDHIEDDKEYITSNKKVILGHDIKAVTMLMYLKPRTAYWKPDRPQIHDTSVCGAVPIPMLGFKKYRNIPYNAWNGACPLIMEVITEPHFDIVPTLEYDPLEDAFHIDLLLGATLASTSYNDVTGEIGWADSWGLFILNQILDGEYRPDYNDVRYYRQYGMGNHKGSFASVYGTAAIPEDDGEHRKTIYNRSSTPMRLMLAQRWAWYGNHRMSDMICDFQNWDNIPKSVDDMSNRMKGLEPQENDKATKLKEVFGFGGSK